VFVVSLDAVSNEESRQVRAAQARLRGVRRFYSCGLSARIKVTRTQNAMPLSDLQKHDKGANNQHLSSSCRMSCGAPLCMTEFLSLFNEAANSRSQSECRALVFVDWSSLRLNFLLLPVDRLKKSNFRRVAVVIVGFAPGTQDKPTVV
jgi:hypothetical protein